MLSILVFVSGAAVMSLEIVGARMMAPYVGTSIGVWTSLISLVMAGLSAGYALGGRLGDKWRSFPRLRSIVALAGAWVLCITLVRDPVLSWLALSIPSLPLAAALGAFILLGPPSVLLGMVGPYAVRLAAANVDSVGRTAGRLSALSTVGSIVGTVAAGFVLLPLLSITLILVTIACLLLICASLPFSRRTAVFHLCLLMVSAGVIGLDHAWRTAVHAELGIVAEEETPYSSIRVQRLAESYWGRNVTLLEIDRGFHAAVFDSDSSALVFEYTRYYRLADAVRPDASRALLLGGGGYTTARDFLSRHPAAAMDAVEIDSGVTELARRYFGLQEDPRLSIHHEDARTFLNRVRRERPGHYHVIFGDAFRSERTIPFHLTTQETAEAIRDLLDDDGAYLLNVIASVQGPGSTFLRAQTATLRSVFPSVLVFRVADSSSGRFREPTSQQNLVIVAAKKPLDPSALDARGDPELAALIGSYVPVEEGGLVLTDEYAPVEAMIGF